MSNKMNLDQIKRHWEDAAERLLGTGNAELSPTSRDPFLGEMEEQAVLSWLRPDHEALELGPGDGLHTVRYAPKVRRLAGIDVSEGLVHIAQQRIAAAGLCNVDLQTGSVLGLRDVYPPEQFDCIISQRCLVNLPEWPMQQETLRQAHALLRPEGLLLLAEGFKEGLDGLNEMRHAVGLNGVQVVSYNCLMIRRDFEAFIVPYFDIVQIRNWGLYMLLSRIFHPLAVAPAEPQHNSPLNAIAMRMTQALSVPNLERCSMNLFYVLHKKPSPAC